MTHVSYASFGLHQTTARVPIPLCHTVSHLRHAMVHFTTVVGLFKDCRFYIEIFWALQRCLIQNLLNPFPTFPTYIKTQESYKYLPYEATPLMLTLYEGNGYPSSIPSAVQYHTVRTDIYIYSIHTRYTQYGYIMLHYWCFPSTSQLQVVLCEFVPFLQFWRTTSFPSWGPHPIGFSRAMANGPTPESAAVNHLCRLEKSMPCRWIMGWVCLKYHLLSARSGMS